MKKSVKIAIALIAIIVLAIAFTACNKNGTGNQTSTTTTTDTSTADVKKGSTMYAIGTLGIFKTPEDCKGGISNANWNNMVTYLSVAEDVTVEEVKDYTFPDPKDATKNFTMKLAKVKTSGDDEGYTWPEYLAAKPIVFLNESSVFRNPSETSDTVATIPKGKIGFVKSEKPGWVKIFSIQIEGQWVGGDGWVKESDFSTDMQLVIQGKKYEKALSMIAKIEKSTDDAAKKKLLTDSLKILNELKDKGTVYAELATTKIDELNSKYSSLLESNQ